MPSRAAHASLHPFDFVATGGTLKRCHYFLGRRYSLSRPLLESLLEWRYNPSCGCRSGSQELCTIARIMRSASSSMLSAPRPKFILFPSFRLRRMRPHRHRRRRLPFPRHVQTAQMVGHRSCYVPSYWRDVAHCNSYTFCVWRWSHRDSDYSRKKDVHHRNT